MPEGRGYGHKVQQYPKKMGTTMSWGGPFELNRQNTSKTLAKPMPTKGSRGTVKHYGKGMM
jgi:hypothetical protein